MINLDVGSQFLPVQKPKHKCIKVQIQLRYKREICLPYQLSNECVRLPFLQIHWTVWTGRQIWVKIWHQPHFQMEKTFIAAWQIYKYRNHETYVAQQCANKFRPNCGTSPIFKWKGHSLQLWCWHFEPIIYIFCSNGFVYLNLMGSIFLQGKHQCCWYFDFAAYLYKLKRVAKEWKKLTRCCIMASNFGSCHAPRKVWSKHRLLRGKIFSPFGQREISQQ